MGYPCKYQQRYPSDTPTRPLGGLFLTCLQQAGRNDDGSES